MEFLLPLLKKNQADFVAHQSQKQKGTKETTRGQPLLGNRSVRSFCGGEAARTDLKAAVKRQLYLLNTGHWFRATCDFSGCFFHSNRGVGS